MAITSAEMIYVVHGPVPHAREADRVSRTEDGIRTGGSGKPDPKPNGQEMRAAIAAVCAKTSARCGLKADCRQIDSEEELIDLIGKADADQAIGLVIDARCYSNTSAALHQSLASVRIPMVDVHAGERYADESFRYRRLAAKAPLATLSGFGIDGYRLAILGLAASTGVSAPA